MHPALAAAYLGIGLLQLAAVMGELEGGAGLHWIVAAPLALLLSYIPLVGSVAGAFGAVHAWGWPWAWAVLLFCCPVAILGAAMLAWIRRAAEAMGGARTGPLAQRQPSAPPSA